MSYSLFANMADRLKTQENSRRCAEIATTAILIGNFSHTPTGLARALQSAQANQAIQLTEQEKVTATGMIHRNLMLQFSQRV